MGETKKMCEKEKEKKTDLWNEFKLFKKLFFYLFFIYIW